jgi:uncharacterized protein YjbI with pentapeptide repeats
MNEEQLDKTLRDLLEDHKKWNDSYIRDGEQLDLTEANLNVANLSNSDLIEACLSYSNLTGAYLRETNLTKADLSYSNLSGAYLTGVKITRSQLNEMIIEEDL